MGFHWKKLGYKDPTEWEKQMQLSEKYHLKAFIKFLKSVNLVTAIRNKDWKKIERKYNGGGWNSKYAKRMRIVYNKLVKKEIN